MPKHNIMRISGWLPVSYSVYMSFERNIGKECYSIAKYVADSLNDNPKLTNFKLLKGITKNLLIDDSKLINNEVQYMAYINFLIDFIRDSFIIYYDTIKQEKETALI